MLAIFLTMTTVGGFSYQTTPIFHRTKRVPSAPDGYKPFWKEEVDTITAKSPKDAAFSRYLRARIIALQRSYYAEGGQSFRTHDWAGEIKVGATLIAASPDIVSVELGSDSYLAGTPHPNTDLDPNIIWSRRLQRPLKQSDVFAVAPDRTLRRLAVSRYSNRDALDQQKLKEGIPLNWSRATIGSKGITWSFGSYYLGGYGSGGKTTLSWSDLKPYLKRNLPFDKSTIRDVPIR